MFFNSTEMLLAIDIGNTKIKCAVFKQDTIIELFVLDDAALQKETEKILLLYPKITDLMISSVRNISKQEFSWMDKAINICFVSYDSDFPFINNYKTPQTLGIDRMILASGATLRYPKQAKLVIDTGTAITYDFIDEEDNYLGGAISAGISLRYKALHNYTAKLPLLEKPEQDYFIGQTTAESIHSGVVNGVVFEIEGFIRSLKDRHHNFIIILTGGDTVFLAKRLKSTIFANQNFLLESLNDLFQYQNR